MTKLNIEFSSNAWAEYQDWKQNNKSMVKKIDKLVNNIIRHPFIGLGKPEPLTGNLQGYWSRRINSEHRFVYGVLSDRIKIVQVKYHYDK